MDDTDLMLKKLGRKTMFNITDEEMPALREPNHVISTEDALKNCKTVQRNQIRVPKVVG